MEKKIHAHISENPSRPLRKISIPAKQSHKSPCACGHDHAHHGEHQAHGTSCNCGQDHPHEDTSQHGETCGCGQEHSPEGTSHDQESCSCGHDNASEDDEPHHQATNGCGHDHNNIAVALPSSEAPTGAGYQKALFKLENLGCANCSAKMEKKIRTLPGVSDAVISYTTGQLRLTAKAPDTLFPQIQKICQSIESEVLVTPLKSRPRPTAKASAQTGLTQERKRLLSIFIGAALFILGEVLERNLPGPWTIPVFLCAYVVLGGRIVLTAAKNLAKGQIFDENFLMSIATLAAIAIQDYPEAVGVMLFYRVGEYFEDRAVKKSRSQIMDAVDMRPEVVNLWVHNGLQVIDAETAMVGDILLVRPGDRIPLDGVIIEGESRIDTSPVTGEPVPVKATAGDAVTSGCVNTSGVLKMRVEKILEESMVTRILDSVENAAASKPKIDRFITRFSRIYTPFVVGLAVLTAIVPSLITGDWRYWITTAITFLVISCPCALVLSVPLAFFSGIGAGSKRGILFKGGVSIEAIKKITTVVMDKTGTITQGNFALQQAVTTGDLDEATLLSLAASCELSSTHPIGNSIVTAAKEQGLTPEPPDSVEEIAGQGILAKRAEDIILCGNRSLMIAQNIDLEDSLAQVYGTEVFVALNGKLVGYLVISDTIKADAADAIAKIKAFGIKTAMLTGDAKESADAVAKTTGIDVVHARLLPQDKLTTLQAIRKERGAVMFVGDGINDAPVLAGADVGAAMGSGADAAIEAADVVFMTSNMEAIPQAIDLSRQTSRIAWQNVIFALVIKAFVILLGFLGFANMWMAVFADTGVAILCVLNAMRLLYRK